MFFINASSSVNSSLFAGCSPYGPTSVYISVLHRWLASRCAVKPRITLYMAVRTSDRSTLPTTTGSRSGQAPRRAILIGRRPDAASRRVPWRSL